MRHIVGSKLIHFVAVEYIKYKKIYIFISAIYLVNIPMTVNNFIAHKRRVSVNMQIKWRP